MLFSRVLAYLGALALCTGCVAQSVAPAATDGAEVEILQQAPVPAALPAFPAEGPPRRVDVIEPQIQLGNAALSHGGNFSLNAGTLTLEPGPGALSFALYRFQTGAFTFAAVDFVITPADPARTWLGLADYDLGHWRLFQSTAGQSTLAHPGTRIVSTDGYCYFIVIGYDGADTAIEQISIDLDLPGWGEYILDDHDLAGETVALALIGETLQIAYSANAASELKLARTDSPVPGVVEDWTTTLITAGTTYGAIDLEQINSLPAVAFVDSEAGTGHYARATSTVPAGAGDWVFAFPAQAASSGFIDLAEVAGNPAVTYVDPGMMMQSVDYAYAAVSAPSAPGDWTVTEAVSNSMTPPFAEFSHPALLVFDGLPALVYYNERSNRLYFTRSSTAAPIDAGNWSSGLVNNSSAGWYCQGVVSGGLPALLYVDQVNSALHYARSASWTPAGTGDWTSHSVDVDGLVHGPLCLVQLSPGVGVAYRDSIGEAVKYAWTEQATPTAGQDWKIVTVAENTGTGSISMALMQNGRPAIAYYNSNTAALVFTWIAE